MLFNIFKRSPRRVDFPKKQNTSLEILFASVTAESFITALYTRLVLTKRGTLYIPFRWAGSALPSFITIKKKVLLER